MENLTFKQNGNTIIMSDEQTYTKESLPGLFNSLKTHLNTLGDQIRSNEQQKVNCEKNLIGLNRDKDVLTKRIEILEKFAAKAHIQIKPILADPKANPQAKAEDNMKVMLKKLVREILDEEEKEMLEKVAGIPECMDQEVFAGLPESYDKVKYIATQFKTGEYNQIHKAYESLDPLNYSSAIVNKELDLLVEEKYISGMESKFTLVE